MKNTLLFLTLFVSVHSFAAATANKVNENDPVKIKTESSKFMGTLRLGGSYTKTEDRRGNEDFGNKIFINADIMGRYAFGDSIAVHAGLGKWFGSGRVSAEAGNLAYNMSAGLIWAINGSMINRTTIETRIKKRKAKRGDKHYFITHTEKSTITNDIDGFRLGAHITQMEFSRLDEPVYGGGLSLFYEQRSEKNSAWQYGVKYDAINTSKVEAHLVQAFIGFGFLP